MGRKSYVIRHIKVPGTNLNDELHVPHRVICENVFVDKTAIQVLEVSGRVNVRQMPNDRFDRLYYRKVFGSLLMVQDFLLDARRKPYLREIGLSLKNVKMPFLFDF